MTKVVDVHLFDDHVQNKINKKYRNIDFNGDFDVEYKKWILFLEKISKDIDMKKRKKIFEMMMQLKIYGENTLIPNTNVKLSSLFQMLISKLQNYFLKNKEKFEILWGYFIEFYGEELSTHCVEGVSNRAFFILELNSDYEK